MLKTETRCIKTEKSKYDKTGALSTPIFQSATFAHEGGINTGFDYSRLQNPTREQLENIVASLEEGIDAMAFSTGMAAITATMELFSPGDHIIAGNDLYGGSIRLFDHISQKNGLTISYVDTADADAVRKAITENTKAIFIETPSNPLMQVTDISLIASIAKDANCLTIVDNTFLTPYFQKPLLLGADIVLHSGSKYLGGHNDTLAGFLVVQDEQLAEKLRFIYKTTGACLAPFDSWLMIRGIKTLALRMKQQEENAKEIATWLQNNQYIEKVYYVGDKNRSDYEISKKQSTGFGAMISFTVTDKSIAEKILQEVRLITYAESLGGVESLITYPMVQTHADVDKNLLESKGINDCFLRLSVGAEACSDLIAELESILS